MSEECQNSAHEDCSSPDTCQCPCHAQQRAIADLMERSLGVTTQRPLPSGHGSDDDNGASNWLADRRQRSYYAPAGDVDLYHPTSPQSAFEQLGMLPHEIETAEDEIASRSIAAMRLRRLLSDTYRAARLPAPAWTRTRPRGLRAWLLGALRLSR